MIGHSITFDYIRSHSIPSGSIRFHSMCRSLAMLDTMRQLVEHSLIVDHLQVAYIRIDLEQGALELRR